MQIHIIEANVEHADILNQLVRQVDQENTFAVRETDEDMGPLNMIEVWLKNVTAEKNQAVFLAYCDDKPAGYLIARGGSYRRVAHSCQFMLGIIKDFHKKGVGTAMLNHAESWAKVADISRIELSYVDGNDSAKKLYEKFNYQQEGTKSKALQINDQFFDEVNLVKFI